MSDSLIYKKLSNVQLALMRKDIKKTGFNKFKKYRYYTLDDLMAPCIEECHREGLTFFFNFRNGEAIIRLHEWEKPEKGITCGLPFPELINPEEDVKNKNNLLVQDLGAAVTYLKRYLLINLFAITDVELIDSDDASSAHKDTKESKQVKKDREPRDLNLQELLDNALTALKKKGLSYEEITPYAVKKCIEKMDKFTKEENLQIYAFVNEYFNKKGASA